MMAAGNKIVKTNYQQQKYIFISETTIPHSIYYK